MSNSVRPHRQQPTRLHCPWESPGKNAGVGCHFLLQCIKVKSEREVTQSFPTLSDPMDYSPPGSSIHGIFQARVLEWGAIAFSRLTLKVGQLRFFSIISEEEKEERIHKINQLQRTLKHLEMYQHVHNSSQEVESRKEEQKEH